MGLVIRKNKQSNFTILIEKFTPERHYERLELKDYHTFGISPSMTYDEAKSAAKLWAKQERLEKKKKINSFLRAINGQSINETYLPIGLIEVFESEIKTMYPDSDQRFETVMQHWRSAQRLICEIQSLPPQFHDKRFLIYNYFKNQKWSADYMKRITKILNQWANFYGRSLKTFVEPIPRIQGTWKQKVLDARFEKDYIRQPALPLTWKLVESRKDAMIDDDLEPHFNFLYIGLAFGLRPSEIDALHNKNTWKLEITDGIHVLHVYQKKLNMIEKSRRWKPIPVLLPQQKIALKMIEDKNHKRPLTKTIQRFFGEGFDCYSPRKGFTDELLSEGFELTDISVYLGHSDISTTWKHYKNKKAFQIPNKFKKSS